MALRRVSLTVIFLPLLSLSLQAQPAYLAGSKSGLYGFDRQGTPEQLWQGGEVRKILHTRKSWVLLSDAGVFVSADLKNWEARNKGLAVKTIKVYENGKKSFTPIVQEIKDLEILPGSTEVMVAATRDAVYLTRDEGLNWVSLGMPPLRTNGFKAVAAAMLPDLTVFVSHSIYGIYYIEPDKRSAKWTECSKGIEEMETTGNPDEIADIASLPASGQASPEIIVSQTFRPRIYRLNWGAKSFEPLWSGTGDFGAIDALVPQKRGLLFSREGVIMDFDRVSGATLPRLDIRGQVERSSLAIGERLNCLFILPNPLIEGSEEISIPELWLLGGGGLPATDDELRRSLADNREGIYIPANRAMEKATLAPYISLMREHKLNMVVIDMKDDYGRFRFTPKNPKLTGYGRVFRPVDLEFLSKTLKAEGIYMVARIVAFKDPEMARREGGRFAVWDAALNKPWRGYYDTRQPNGKGKDENSAYEQEILPGKDSAYEILRTYYDETWVDPYSEEVWEYIADLSRELCERGFDEIQFDYIRFPTDGQNLGNARYRWRDSGMDMESALLSFLRHIRSRINAPISIDIYGANGWYRTGARTGQDVELLTPYIDVICPMYYPSHFEQTFLAQAPPELRPWRIYYLGALRTAHIARGRIVVRSYVQAFYLGVSYDIRYYGKDYVRLERQGVYDAGSRSLTYWNNAGRYEDLP
jgi:hypothetical protein